MRHTQFPHLQRQPSLKGLRKRPPGHRVPRGRRQARAAHGTQSVRGGEERRDRNRMIGPCSRAVPCAALRDDLHRQGGGPDQHHGGHRSGRGVHRPGDEFAQFHRLHHGALRQRPQQQRQRRPDLLARTAFSLVPSRHACAPCGT